MMNAANTLPLVSVIIPTYNYAGFLSKSVESVLNQTYKNFEVIIIDDGSVDNTKSIAKKYTRAKYYYQNNKGLAAARNNGIRQSKGRYLVFLDADDWLEKDALEQNYLTIKDKAHLAFVSGNYYFIRADTNESYHVTVSIPGNHYEHMLRSNYIGMHATVMFQRWVFREFRYDETLKACEDYDLYLNILRKYPALHHQKFIATYFFHSSGLSHNYKLMMDSINMVMKKQEPYIKSYEEKCAYEEGLHQWKDYYKLLKEQV